MLLLLLLDALHTESEATENAYIVFRLRVAAHTLMYAGSRSHQRHRKVKES